jgi:RHS repeat-associated protein
VLDEARESDSVAYNAGIGGTVARSTGNGEGRFGPTATADGTTSENDSQMAELGFSLSVNGNINTHDVNEELLDINGDGLPDRLTNSGGQLFVQLNLGYEFAGPERWDAASAINTGNGESLGGGANLGYNDGIYGFGGGVSVASSAERINEYIGGFQRDGQTLSDVNGDGLVDRVVADGADLLVRFNTGQGFAGLSRFSGLQDWDVTQNRSTTVGAGVYFTIGIGPLCLAGCYLIINAGGDANESLQRPESALQDVNGDGYTDHIVSENDGELTAAINNTDRTNLLKVVHRPMQAWFEIDYTRTGNTFEQPQSRWALSRVTVFDGHAGDGADYQLTTYGYGPGFYDRFEREFYGYTEVDETQFDTRGLTQAELGSATAYRETKREFHNESFFLQGAKKRETTLGFDTGPALTYGQTDVEYVLRVVDGGAETTDPATLKLSESAVFPQITAITKKMHEGDPLVALTTHQEMTYDALGNMITLSDGGDSVTTADDYNATVTYTGDPSGDNAGCADQYIVGKADSIVVRNAGSVVLRQRALGFDCTTGDLIHLEESSDSTGGVSVSDYGYQANGLLNHVVNPQNDHGQRYTLDYLYDSDTQGYVTRITDSFALQADMEYDLRFGLPSSATDNNGNTITRTYDDFGRLATVVGPYEQGTGYSTVVFDYHMEAAVPYARTKNLDPFRDPDDPIETYVFTDGLKRVLQTKKDITLFQGKSADATDQMSVSGRVTFDQAGRTTEMYYPTVEAKDDTTNATFNEVYDDGAPPTRQDYDVLDRLTLTTYPDATTRSVAYALGTDRHGVLREAQTVTDGLLRSKVNYSDIRKQATATQEFNTTKGEVIWTEYTFDPLEQLTDIIDDHANHTTITYDRQGRRTLLDNPDSGQVAMTYDPAGNVTHKVTANLAAAGESIAYDYDFTRIVAIHYPDFPGNDVAYEYGGADLRGHGGNRAGRIIRVTDESGVDERRYGKLGEIVQATKTLASDTLGACSGCPEVWRTEYVHDTWGRMQQMTYPDGEVLTYSYDSGGNVRAAKGVKLGIEYPYVERLEYDKFEKRAFLEYNNGIETEYSYDPTMRRLDRLQAGQFQDLAYQYDAVGNVLHIANEVPSGHPNEMGGAVEQSFAYDSLYRLTHASGTFQYGPQKTNAYELSMDYDTINDILSKSQLHTVQTKDNKPIVQHKTTYDWTYEYSSAQPHAASRIVGEAAPGFEDRAYSYDANGNQTGWDDLTSGRRRTIVWDEENRMQSISDNGRTTTFKYNDVGQRIIKRGAQGETAYINQYWTIRNRQVGTKHVYINETRLVSKLSPGNAHAEPGADLLLGIIKNWHDHHVGIFPGRMGGRLPDDNFVYYYHADHLGSTGWVTDKDGELYEHMEYFPTGETWVAENSNTERLPYLFTGQEIDQETDLYYHGARYYDPKTTAWQSVDPQLVDKPAGAVGAAVRLAAYTYANTNPLRLVDPDGRQGRPPNLEFGIEAHEAIEDYYRMNHPMDDVYTGERSIGGMLTDVTGDHWKATGCLRTRPDIFNASTGDTFEIKSETEYGLGDATVEGYVDIINDLEPHTGVCAQRGPSAEFGGNMGVILPTETGRILDVWSPEPGVVLYKEINNEEPVPVPVYVPQEQTNEEPQTDNGTTEKVVTVGAILVGVGIVATAILQPELLPAWAFAL